MPRFSVILLPLAAMLFAACGQFPGKGGAEAPPRGPQAAAEGVGSANARSAADAGSRLDAEPEDAPPADIGVDVSQPPRWRSAEDLVTGLPPADAAEPGAEGVATVPEADPFLRQLVAERCANRPAGITEGSLLSELVADLDADGVPPADAADALIMGRCGDLADVVTEVVARGGEAAAIPVIERSVALVGSASTPVVERAAAQGLMLAGRERVASNDLGPSALAGTSGDYAMVYFPLGGGENSGAERAAPSLAQLLGAGEPGYGIYTYILSGDIAAVGADADERLATYRELLRVIETYVLVEGPDGSGPDAGAHTFLVPVHAGREGAALVERTGPELSAAMRRELSAYLRRGGQPALAARLATSPGPFLVSSLEPRLVPNNRQAPRMIVDLSAIGPEYMYTIVDAYDRQIPPEFAGRPDSLLAVRGRLIGLFPDTRPGADGAAPQAGDWVFLLGRRTMTQVPTVEPQWVRLAALNNSR